MVEEPVYDDRTGPPAHGKSDGAGLRIGIAVSRWNSAITSKLYRGAIDALLASGVDSNAIMSIETPGAFELPLALASLASQDRLDGLVALGCVIKGETAHFEYIADSAISGIREVSLKFSIPIGCGVLTVMNEEQAEARAVDGDLNKGAEAARTTIEMINLLKKISFNRTDADGQSAIPA